MQAKALHRDRVRRRSPGDAEGIPVLRKEDLDAHLQKASIRKRMERVQRLVAERKKR